MSFELDIPHPQTIDAKYGPGTWDFTARLINELAPVTRRDEWWCSDGPYEIIARALHNRLKDCA